MSQADEIDKKFCCILLLTLHTSRGEDEKKCYGGTEASTQLQDWISRSLQNCRLAGGDNCQREPFQDIELTILEGGDGRSWFITSSSGWSLKHRRFPRAPAYQGAFYYDELPGENGVRRGVYLYPDWSSCVSGRFCLSCVMCHVS